MVFLSTIHFKMWLFSYCENSLDSESLDSPYLPLIFPDVSNTHFTKSTIWIEKEKFKWPTVQHKVCHPPRGARAFLGVRCYTGSNGEAAIILLQVTFAPNSSHTAEDLPQDLQKYGREGKCHCSIHSKEMQHRHLSATLVTVYSWLINHLYTWHSSFHPFMIIIVLEAPFKGCKLISKFHLLSKSVFY